MSGQGQLWNMMTDAAARRTCMKAGVRAGRTPGMVRRDAGYTMEVIAKVA